KNATIKTFHYQRKDLRYPFPKKKLENLVGLEIVKVKRRAKYLLLETQKGFLLSHLGMTGTWRVGAIERLHDHFAIELSDGRLLVYNDPRRFGFIDFVEIRGEAIHPRLKHLGSEPFAKEFSAENLKRQLAKRKIACKVALMDQKVVVGVGNIYASEALFLAKISPKRKAHLLKINELEKLVAAIQEVLRKAIAAGGSTISDFKNAEGESGYFQTEFQVYERDKDKCRVCGGPILKTTQAGRSTYWCKTCQK
ncbi:MAG: bifunctional DNA-formamidopyrimidine glycosylase/DNA-(apurinic or apyrimidinic site) lyase, partial [Pseudobdellovibrionaceae bacterium]